MTTTTGCTFSPTNTAPHCRLQSTTIFGRRFYQHRSGEVEGFTSRYRLNRVVWVGHFRNVNDAIACEKKIEGWRRSRKIALVEQTNPRWLDLSDDWEQQPNVYDRPVQDGRILLTLFRFAQNDRSLLFMKTPLEKLGLTDDNAGVFDGEWHGGGPSI